MRRVASITLALPPLLYSAAAAVLWGLFVTAMQCDEICDPDSADWRYTRGAWQWYAIGALGVAAFVAGVLFFSSVVRRRSWAALAWLLVGTAAVVIGGWGFPVNPGSDQELDLEPSFYVVSAATFASGVIAALLALSARGRRG
jgi:hypothetical protein